MLHLGFLDDESAHVYHRVLLWVSQCKVNVDYKMKHALLTWQWYRQFAQSGIHWSDSDTTCGILWWACLLMSFTSSRVMYNHTVQRLHRIISCWGYQWPKMTPSSDTNPIEQLCDQLSWSGVCIGRWKVFPQGMALGGSTGGSQLRSWNAFQRYDYNNTVLHEHESCAECVAILSIEQAKLCWHPVTEDRC